MAADKHSSFASSLGTWLRNAVFLALVVLLAMCSYLVFRSATLIYRLEQSVVAVSSDVKEVASTAATLSQDVAAIREDIVNVKEKALDSIRYEEARHAIDEAIAFGAAAKAESSQLTDTAEEEISALLKSLVVSGCTAEVYGRKQSIMTLYGRIYGKYKLKQNVLTSAEDFIAQIASKSVLGNTYYLVDKDGEKSELSEWLTNRLKAIRKRNANDGGATR